MKALLTLVCTVLLVCNMAFAGDLVTGRTKYDKFEPGDRVLVHDDFSQCPVGEAPAGFDKIIGAVECVKYEEHIWVAPSTDEAVFVSWALCGQGVLSVSPQRYIGNIKEVNHEKRRYLVNRFVFLRPGLLGR